MCAARFLLYDDLQLRAQSKNNQLNRHGVRSVTSVKFNVNRLKRYYSKVQDRLMSFFIQAPETFNFNNQTQWPNWIRCYERYLLSSKPSEKDKKNQVNTLKYPLGNKADDILSSLQLNNEQSSNYDIVKTRFDKYFSVKKIVIYELAVFNKRVQMPNEPLYDFTLSFHCLVKHCKLEA